LLASAMAAPDGAKAGIDMFVDAWNGTAAMGGDMPFEVHRGAAGFACAATDLLRGVTDLRPAERDGLVRVQVQSTMLVLGNLERPFPERSDEVGMAHGVAGQLYACLRASAPSDIIARRMNEFVDIAIDQPPLIQWPAALDTRKLDWLPSSLCRGLSGVLILLCAAAQAFRSERFAGIAARAAFMLRNLPPGHPSLCCGATGQANAVNHYAALSGCSTSRRWARARLRWAAEAASLPPFELWQGRPGIALGALAVSGKGALPLFTPA
jgi:lanthionine synthetase-like protein